MQEISNRYGKSSITFHRAWGDEAHYQANGFTITVCFVNGVSAGESYTVGLGQQITDYMQVSLLQANSEGYPWNDVPTEEWPKTFPAVKGMWRRPNGSIATQTDRTFEVKSINLIIAEDNAAHPKPVTPSTQGF